MNAMFIVTSCHAQQYSIIMCAAVIYEYMGVKYGKQNVRKMWYSKCPAENYDSVQADSA